MNNKSWGILGLFVAVFLVTALGSANFLQAYNLENILKRASLYGILSLGVSYVIVTGGIDLSVGSVVGLVGALLPLLLTKFGWPWWLGLGTVVVGSTLIGLTHGLLITRLQLQPFVVTLCGLLVYRGVARWATGDATQGFRRDFPGLRYLATGEFPGGTWPVVGEFHLPVVTVLLLVLAAASAIFFHRTIFGRYLLAVGGNETAARYSGIRTARWTVIAYAICSTIAGCGGVLFALESNSIQPDSFGNFYELYAIAGAVLGGCSLRGGEVSVVGVITGAAIMQLLYNSINMLGISTTLEFAVIGLVLMAGVIADELLRRWSSYRALQAKRQRPDASSKA